MPQPALPGPLVTGEWLAQNHGHVALADVRWSLQDGPKVGDYHAGHLPGAVFVDLDADISDTPGRSGRHPLPPAPQFLAMLEAKGLTSLPVVCYDDVGGGIAARLWWMLDSLGFDAAVLDGGVGAWPGNLEATAASTPTTINNAIESVSQATSIDASWPSGRLATANQVSAVVADSSAPIVDARSPERFQGQPNPVDQPPGHMPGARSHPWQKNLDRSLRFLPPDQLRAQFESLGIDGEQPWIATCGSGVTACQNLLAARVAGIDGGVLYAGSWSEWTQDTSRPIATSLSED